MHFPLLISYLTSSHVIWNAFLIHQFYGRMAQVDGFDNIDLRAQLELLHASSFGWALSCCSHRRADAEDVLQTAYLKILEGRAVFKGRSSFKTWLFSVIRVTAKEERRRAWLRFLRLAKFAEEKTEIHSDEQDTGGQDSAWLAARFRELLDALPARQREIIHLVMYQDMTIEDASAVMGVSLGSARTHYERAKGNLRKLLSESEVQNEGCR